MNLECVATDGLLNRLVQDSAAILGEPVLSARRLTKGGNNITMMLETTAGRFVAKHYPQTPGDNRDRFAAEAGALRFMNDAEIACVPALIGSNPGSRLVVMDSSAIADVNEPRDEDITACSRFVESLHKARNKQGASNLPLAADACVSPCTIAEQILNRRDVFNVVAENHPALAEYLMNAFDPAFARQCEATQNTLAAAGIRYGAAMAHRQLTLSPSDFGLHNTVRNADGSLVFIDFEYFGWDDPVRLVSDFVLHPGHQLNNDHKRRFIEASTEIFAAQDSLFQVRLNALYPLVGMRWCMIVLNEFLPERLARRRAAGNADDLEGILERQLEKSRQLLATLNNGRRHIFN